MNAFCLTISQKKVQMTSFRESQKKDQENAELYRAVVEGLSDIRMAGFVVKYHPYCFPFTQ